MSFSFNSFRAIFVVIIVLFGSFALFADTIRLKDGSIVKGKVTGFRDGQFVIVIGEGARQRQMTFFADEIETIEFDSTTGGSAITKIPAPPAGTQSSNQPKPTPTPVSTPTPNSNPNVRVIGNPPAEEKPVEQPKSDPPATKPKTNAIKINSKVLADNTANGWTNTGWVVRKGQKIKISGTGRISLGNGRYSTPSGVSSLPDNNKLMKDKPTGGLVAVIGDDNNDFIFVGGSVEFTATRDGALFLGVNEEYLDDNSGSFDIVIEIEPGS